MTITLGSVASPGIQRQLKGHLSDLSSSLERLSSGLRINHASDDPAGLQLATALDAQTRILTKAVQNINDGISLVNTTDSALNELLSILARQDELATQAANGGLSATQRQALDRESEALVDEFNRIVASTYFNGINPLDLTRTEVLIMAGSHSDDSISVSLAEAMSRNAGDGTFGTRATSGSFVYTAALGDMNGDGITDVISGRSLAAGAAVDVLISNGNGTFSASISFQNGGASLGIGTGDLDGDGDLDVVSPSEAEGKVNVFLGNGNGTLQARVSLYLGIRATGASVVDLDEDGNLDIVAADWNRATYNVLIGNGNGTFDAQISYDLTGAGIGANTVIADLNNDGRHDLLISGTDNNIYAHLGNGNGTFQGAQVAAMGGGTTANYSQELAVSDLNHDGYADLVQTLDQNNALAVLFGRGDGTFSSAVTYGLGFSPTNSTLTDVNGDGRPDILAAGTSNSIRVLLNNGAGTFSYGQSLDASSTVNATIAHDFNGDGVLDLLGGSDASNIFIATSRRVTTMPYLNLSSVSAAGEAQETIDDIREKVEAQAGRNAAALSRLSHAVSYAQVARENMSAAGSQITSLDVAEEVARMTSSQILANASQAILAQANQQGSIVIQLIDGL